MGQVTTGLFSMLSHPYIYSAFQSLMGANDLRRAVVKEFIRPFPGCVIVDLGCGPADILSYLYDVEYYGFDISPEYIAQADKRFGRRGKFYCKEFMRPDLDQLPRTDMVLALGVLHHLDDESASTVLKLAHQSLKPGGRFVSFDPCFDTEQTPIARFLVSNDRGKNVRTKAAYESIANAVFDSPRVEVRHRAWIPYTHCFMECTRK